MVASELWKSVLPVLLARLSYTGSGQDMDGVWSEAVKLAELVGVDVEPHLQRAREEIPEPASWSKLKADGTPKTESAKDKKAKKKKRKKAVASK